MNRSFSLVVFTTISLSLSAYSIKDAQNDLRKDYYGFQNIITSKYTTKDRDTLVDAAIALMKQEFGKKGKSAFAATSQLTANLQTLVWNHHLATDKIGKFGVSNIEKLKPDHVAAILGAVSTYAIKFTVAAIKKFTKMDKEVLKQIEAYDWQAKETFRKERRKNISTRQVFGNLAGELPKDVLEVIEFIRGAKKYKELGAQMPSGILLEGPPGTGKTSIAKAIADEVGAEFFSASGSQFVNKWVGQGPANVRALFDKARNAKGKAIIFIDEIDAVGAKRSGQSDGGNKEYDNTVNELLVQMDGFDASDDIFVIAATNHASRLDDALTRPGRFDRIIKIGLPHLKNRKAIIQHYAKGLPKIAKDVDYGKLARKTGGFSGADLKQMVNEAAVMAVRDKANGVSQKHFLKALGKIKRHIKSRKQWNGNFGNYTFESSDEASCRDAFAKLAGELPEDVLEIIDFIKDADRFRQFGASMPKGVLLEGPPGTGKTTIARCIAQSAGAAFFCVSGSQFANKYVGQGPANVRKLFDAARQAVESGGCKQAVIFIDEIDAVAKKRGSDGNSERDSTLNELLAQMDGFAQNPHIFVIAATNNAHLLDPAIKRPGRFDRVVKIGLPTEKNRLAILAHYAKQLPMRAKLVLKKLAEATKGCSGAVLKNLVNEAAVFAARDKKANRVEQKHFDLALKKMVAAGYVRRDYSSYRQIKSAKETQSSTVSKSDTVEKSEKSTTERDSDSKGWFSW